MYKALFRYYPVGQGCFYTGQIFAERHSLFNFVYDCGTNSEQDYLVDAIDSSPIKKVKNSRIHVCMISHFHHDHTGGIPHLLNGTRCDRLVIPYYDMIERLIIYLQSGSNNEEYRRMMEDPYSYFSGDGFDIGEIVVVGGGPENQILEPGRPVAPVPGSEGSNREDLNFAKQGIYTDDWQDEDTNLASFQQFEKHNPDADLGKVSVKTIPYQMRTPLYKFVFYVRTMESGSDTDAKLKIEQLKKQINAYYYGQLKDPKSKVTEFKDLFGAVHIKEITRIYGSVFGGTNKLNGTSLAVFHHSILSPDGYIPYQILMNRIHRPYLQRHEHGSLMTGDLDLETREKLELFQDYYQYYLNDVGYFQVMHHGSDRNWPFGVPASKLHTFPAYVINHGAGRAHHPGKEVGKLLRRHRPHHVFLNNEFTPLSYGYYFRLR